MRILMTGSGGMLGQAIQQVFTKHEFINPKSFQLDVRNYEQVILFRNLRPDIIFHLAAATDHIACEFMPSDAYMTNTIGTQNMVELARDLDIPIVYISTGGVFEGNKPFYVEDDMPCPINSYSRSKYYGEILVKFYKKHFIIRSGWMMGGGPKDDKKFVNKIFKQIQEGARNIHAISDVFGSPTYAKDLAEGIREIIKMDFGIYHCANSGIASRYDVAKVFVRCLGIDKLVKVIPRTFTEFYSENKLACPYTKNEVIESSKIPPLRFWEEALKEYTEKEFKPCLKIS